MSVDGQGCTCHYSSLRFWHRYVRLAQVDCTGVFCMGRYSGPKGRVNRRLGAMVFENTGAVKALEKRPNPPGMAERRRKSSTYGLALADKQKIKYHYGMREAQLRRYFAKARAQKG